MTPSEQRHIVETLRTDYPVRQICETLGFHRSLVYYPPKSDPSEVVLEAEIEQLCARYPRYGYRRITRLLANEGYPVGYRRGVSRLMKEKHLWVSVKRGVSRQTTTSLEGAKPWGNRLETLDISRRGQVWVADITYVRLKRRFVSVALLMDVFTRRIRAWQVSDHLNTSLTLKVLEPALRQSVREIHHSDQGVQYL